MCVEKRNLTLKYIRTSDEEMHFNDDNGFKDQIHGSRKCWSKMKKMK